MAIPLQSLRILGVHPVQPAAEQFRNALEILWGSDLSETDAKRAEQNVREHFNNLYLIEVQINPPNADVDWCEFTQPVPHSPKSEWQVPYDERAINEATGRWAFFMHFVDFSKPLDTPVGPHAWPDVTPIPVRLSMCEYDIP